MQIRKRISSIDYEFISLHDTTTLIRIEYFLSTQFNLRNDSDFFKFYAILRIN
jgi:hypothetical protein